ncbi:hypothetical protein [Undibacterium sp. Ji22W]|uniref:hypothetical protein n=1 Tax=Undibacterium sp. Ji22W TaxID=3413038 RepID=UPI003BF30BF6
MNSTERYQETLESLVRVQQFEASTLSRENALGTQLSFLEAVKPAEKLIEIYKRIPITSLEDFSDEQLLSIGSLAQSDFNLFTQILEFDATNSNAADQRTNILNLIKSRRDQVFSALWLYISYGVARSTDTSLLESQARAAIQTIKDQSTKLTQELLQSKDAAEVALAAIRAVASEQGVSQQAAYFKEEASEQEILANTWLTYTYRFAFGVILFAVLSLMLHKLPWIKPESNAEMFQLISSKFLIFAVLGYLLLMSAKNYSTHKHNAVVNKHRQNALLTYRALVEAAGQKGTEDIILAHAASCIFSPQETGFGHGKNDSSSGSKSVLELLTKGGTKSTE